MFVTNPNGKPGIICNTCSIIIKHEISSEARRLMPDGVDTCIQCFNEKEQEAIRYFFDGRNGFYEVKESTFAAAKGAIVYEKDRESGVVSLTKVMH